MIKLRLKRFGKKREASFRLVVCNSTSRRDGRPLQELGFYNPRTKETRLDTEALRTRLSQGAQPTDAVRSLLEKGGLLRLWSLNIRGKTNGCSVHTLHMFFTCTVNVCKE